MSVLRILHLSDIHLSQGTTWDSDEVLTKASECIREICNSELRPHLIAVTGDLANWGRTDEYDLVRKWIDHTFISTGGTAYSQNSLLFVLGNHDVERKLVSTGAYAIQSNLSETADQKQIALVLSDENDKATMFRRHRNYLGFLSEFYGKPVTDPWWRTQLELDDSIVQIDGLCSSWMSCDAKDKGKLLIGRYQFSSLPKFSKRPDVAIALVHHPIDYLQDFDAEHTLGQFESEYDIVLRGHLHSQSASARTSVDRGYLELATGALYAGSTYPNAFQLLEVVTHERKVRVHFFLWHRNSWVLDRVAYRNAIDGVAEMPFVDTVPGYEAPHVSVTSAVEAEAATAPESSIDFGYQGEATLFGDAPSPQDSQAILSTVPQYQIILENHHQVIRQAIRAEAETNLRKERTVWISSDWGTGRRPFISSLINRFSTAEVLPPAYHLNCDDVQSADGLLDFTASHFGMSLQRFCHLASAFKHSFLIIEDLHAAATESKGSVSFQRIVESALQYCGSLFIIVVSRIQPPDSVRMPHVHLSPLDEIEIRDYLAAHSRHRVALDVDVINRIEMATGGLPRNLDTLVDRLQVTSLDDALQSMSAPEAAGDAAFADIPKSLISQIQFLKESTDKGQRHSYRLLEALSVLEAGVTLQSIKRLYPVSPFREQHATTLLDLSMIDAAPLTQGAISDASEKLLRVPRAIREYVRTLISDDDFHSLLHAAAATFFGRNWRNGTIKLSKIANGDQGVPGNEHVLCLHLLRRAIALNDESELDMSLAVYVNYATCLWAAERYRDGYISTQEAQAVLKNTDCDSTQIESHKRNIRIVFGKCARMIGHNNEAVDVLSEIAKGNRTLDADVGINLALAQKSSGSTADAIATANKLCESVPTDSPTYIHAKSILIEFEKQGEELDTSLQRLERKARNKGFTTVADNITLDRIASCRNVDKIHEYAALVMHGDGSDYNKLRARIKRVVSLLDLGRASEITEIDRKWIERGYGYFFGQRMNALFDDCHSTLWRLYAMTGDRTGQLKLFRHSSFLWRLRGEDAKEKRCVEELEAVDFSDLEGSREPIVKIDLRYLIGRIAVMIGLSNAE